MALLDRLPADRFQLEWKLPWWLGRAIGLDPAIAYEVVASNVLALASTRLQDDLADGDVAPADQAAAVEVSGALFEAAMEPYRSQLPSDSPFWPYLDRTLAGGHAAITAGQGKQRRLGALRAPLKIGAMATCLLADRRDLLESIDSVLDDAIEALVLYDHVAKWERDVGAGRWNVFVASIPGAQAAGDDRKRIRSAVLAALLTSDCLRDAFSRIDISFRRASAGATELDADLERLSDALDELAAEARAYGRDALAHYGELGKEVANLLVPSAIDRRS